MLSKVPKIATSTGKLYRLALIGLAALAMIVTSPAFAANPEATHSQPPQPPSPKSPEATCPPGGQCFADVPSTNPF
jgi:hypothetical protein